MQGAEISKNCQIIMEKMNIKNMDNVLKIYNTLDDILVIV